MSNMKPPPSISYSSPGCQMSSNVVMTSETLEDEYEHPSSRQSRSRKMRHSKAATAAAASATAAANLASSSQKNNNTNKSNHDKTQGYMDEKAAIRKSILVQGAGFRREKQDIVAAMGHSPALLLTPSADIRLKRKLDSFNNNNNSSYNNDYSNGSSRRSISSNPGSGSQRYSPGGTPLDPLGPIYPLEPQQQSRSSRWPNDAIEPVTDRDEEIPHNLSNDGIDEYAIDQAEIKSKRFRCYVIVAIVASLFLGAVIGVVVALTQSATAGTSSGDECTSSNPANTGCIVPECARMKYEELTALYPSLPDYDVTRSLADNGDCAADRLAANALAVRWTNSNNNDEMEDSDVYFALATFYFSLKGEKWNHAQNWLQPLPMCEWHGVNCTKDKDGKKDVIVALSLPDNHLVGDVPTHLGLLTSLQSLSLTGNSLGGTNIPSEIGRLLDLETLNLRKTEWTGQLPSEIGLCTKLTMLDLWDTDLTGTVPTEIGNCQSLELLQLGSASLAGPLPTEIGHLSRLTTLSVFVLSTIEAIAIPSEVTVLSNMRNLYLEGIATPSDTWLTDAFVVMTGLTSLSLGNYAFLAGHDSSTIPTQIGLLTALDTMRLASAGLGGNLPTELARLSKLTTLELWTNLFSGTIPTELGLLTDLVVLNLSDNQMLTGSLPSEVGLLTKLSVADFVLTMLSQQIPLEVCALGLEVKMSEGKTGEFANGRYIDACK